MQYEDADLRKFSHIPRVEDMTLMQTPIAYINADVLRLHQPPRPSPHRPPFHGPQHNAAIGISQLRC